MFDVHRDPDKTARQFLGLLSIPVTAVGAVSAIAGWSLVTQGDVLPPLLLVTGMKTIAVLVVQCTCIVIVMCPSLNLAIGARLNLV